MIVPLQDDVLIKIYRCGVCKKTWLAGNTGRGGTTFSCAVSHPPGSCCHYIDKEVSGETIDAIRALLLPGVKDA